MWTTPARAWRAAASLPRAVAALTRRTPTLKQVKPLVERDIVERRIKPALCCRGLVAACPRRV